MGWASRRARGPARFEHRRPGEEVEAAALRELREETGLELACERTELGTEWIVFVAEAPAVAEVVVNEEHDLYLWLPARESAAKCLPPNVRASILAAERVLGVH